MYVFIIITQQYNKPQYNVNHLLILLHTPTLIIINKLWASKQAVHVPTRDICKVVKCVTTFAYSDPTNWSLLHYT